MKTALVIFGITGDLSQSKLLPALDTIVGSGEFDDLKIVGISRKEFDVKALVGNTLASRTEGFTMDLASSEDYVRLKDFLKPSDDEQVLFYLSVPPSAATDIVEFLGQAGLNGSHIKLLFEKPFGFDVESAHDAIARTSQYFSDEQIYRIDHYMAKEVAAELIRLRSDAETHHHKWSNETVEAVNIIASEKVGVGHRATFYEQTGALRDVVQGHLMQLLSLVLMDLTAPFSIEQLAERRHLALQNLDLATPERSFRAQYKEYQDEVHNPGSRVETFVTLELSSSDERWRDVPLRLTTGKALDQKAIVIIVQYKDGTKDVFEEGSVLSTDSRLQGAYERVIAEAIRGQKHIFTTANEVIRSWEILRPLQQAWEFETVPLHVYPKGASIGEVLNKHHM